MEALERIGPVGATALLVGLGNECATVRWAIAQILGRVGTGGTLAAVRELCTDQDEGVREAAQVAVERIEARVGRSG